jgi:putative DNA primase/helicase
VAPKLLVEKPQWLVWKFESQPGDKKPRKVPYYAGGARRTGEQGSDDDRAQLVSYATAQASAATGRYSGIGFAFLPGDGLIGIDLDSVIDEDGVFSERARNIIDACGSYTEFSPSRRGVHIFVAGESDTFKNNAIGVEVFCGRQFFTWTGDHVSDTPLEIGPPVDPTTLARLRATVRGEKKKGARAPAPAASLTDELMRVESALAFLAADDYHQWIEIGLALKASLGESGFALWDRWSMRSGKYPGTDATAKRWATFQPTGISVGTVFELAKRAGWAPPRQARRKAPPPQSQPRAPDDGDAPSPRGQSGGAPPPADDDEGDQHDPGDKRPLIRWIQGKLPEVVEKAEDALIASGLRIYQRAGFLVRVVRRDTPSVRHYKRRPPGALGILSVDGAYLVEAMTRAARWEKFNAKRNKWQRCNAPEQVAATYLSRRGHWQVPRLWSAISSPTLRPDGTVLQAPGYDVHTQSWYDPCGIEFPPIPESPTREDADAALKVLRSAFATFPFESKADESVALALALTALVRRSLPSAPLGGITAPVMASGKTLLGDAISILATGVSAPAMKYADTDEEATKTMLAVLAEGDQVVLIDNVERPLEGDTLCAVLTSEAYRQRVLGRTEMMSVPTTTLFLATGNQLVITGDLRTRALLCRLDPKTEHPERRQFDVELREWITLERPRLVAAGLTVLRAFIATGQKPQEQCNTWGRFERWSDMVRAPIIWLGGEDPCASLADLAKEDPERIELVRVIDVWGKCFGAEGYTAAEAIDRAKSSDALNLVLLEVCRDRDGSLNPRRLASWLRKHADRIADGKRIVRAGERDHTLLWKVETIAQVRA